MVSDFGSISTTMLETSKLRVQIGCMISGTIITLVRAKRICTLEMMPPSFYKQTTFLLINSSYPKLITITTSERRKHDKRCLIPRNLANTILASILILELKAVPSFLVSKSICMRISLNQWKMIGKITRSFRPSKTISTSLPSILASFPLLRL